MGESAGKIFFTLGKEIWDSYGFMGIQPAQQNQGLMFVEGFINHEPGSLEGLLASYPRGSEATNARFIFIIDGWGG